MKTIEEINAHNVKKNINREKDTRFFSRRRN